MIGTLTFHNTTNYGAMYQTYALQKAIFRMGYDNEVIQYICPEIEKNESPIVLKSTTNPRVWIRGLLMNRHIRNKKNKFSSFFEKNIKHSPHTYKRDDLKSIACNYERVIVGSDQVWNTEITNSDYTFFLDWIENSKMKHSYAASFGYEDVKGDFEYQKELLSEFSSLNVREKTGKSIIKSLIEKDANVVLDPTLLLEANEWDRFVDKRIIEKPYVFVYLITRTKENFRFIRRFAKNNGLSIIYINDYIKVQHGMKNIRAASPEEFLNYLKNAQYVITGSFHGLCLSLNYNKDFVITLATHNKNSRIIDLLDLVELNDRVLDVNKETITRIDYSKVNEILKKERLKSLQELKNVCEMR